MARKKQGLQSTETVTVLPTKPGKTEEPLRPNLSRESASLPVKGVEAISQDGRADLSRVGKKWKLGIPKVVLVHKPGSNGGMINERPQLPEMEHEFEFTFGSPVAVNTVPEPIMEELQRMGREGGIVLQFGTIDIPVSAVEVEEEIEVVPFEEGEG